MPEQAAPALPLDPAHAEWAALLDEFERALETDVYAEWRPAANPLPAALAPRARRILAAQHRRAAELSRQRDDAQAHLGAVRLVPSAPADHPAYLDLEG